ncbi:TrkH family potassium uptake protein [Rhodobacter sp. HX-7-19]|uniref:Trk system potassium uptake protein n=1 Tax=Paragemmobacter kunshanensis TaxID=2583234 RepID=A0A6M1TVD8_9RHOB|nr:TrkH family potassium uptake protein [Rhodobacter kunshanensis]NGQ89972.1 TrkH family potassium uptake protein [Rhodobacter kunshanensis]
MIDPRPVAHVIGLVIVALGGAMLFPMILDLSAGDPNWAAFLKAGMICLVAGGATALATANSLAGGLTLQQIFLLTVLTWVAACFFGALPLVLGAPGLDWTEAIFEATSGLTTTGATMIVGLDDLPLGANLWRGMLHWLGGLGIVIVAMLFLPVMKVGGMQFFRSEGFDTLGKILPRALDISSALVQIYVVLTLACAATYAALGMSGFDAVVHALSTVSTGGFSTSDQSFGKFVGPLEYAAVVFMLAGSLPFIRFIQLWQGEWVPMWKDRQVRAYLRWNAYAVAAIVVYEMGSNDFAFWAVLREASFNVVSVFSGTGFTSTDLSLWGPFPFAILFITGLIGGCTSSTGCSVKVFRYLILFEAVKLQLRRLYEPNAVNALRYDGRAVGDDVLNAVISFFTLFMLTFGLLAVALGLAGLEFKTAVTAAWTAIANVGPAFGPEVHPTGALLAFPDAAKWIMILGMLIGRLELMAVYVILMPRFWRT